MCGIIGYGGFREAGPVLLQGLLLLEYRGYDSFGIAVDGGDRLHAIKRVGRISDLPNDKPLFPSLASDGEKNWHVGIGHTRWATHGPPSDKNAHPHYDCTGKIAIVHNGIIENYHPLKEQLIRDGHSFSSDTDSEVIAHLIEEAYFEKKEEGPIPKRRLAEAVEIVTGKIFGSYAILVTAVGVDEIVAVRSSGPLVLGIGDSEFIFASDMLPIIEYTNRVVYPDDGDIVCVTNSGYHIHRKGDGKRALDSRSEAERKEEYPITVLSLTLQQVKKGGYPHYMLKEIYEEPEVLYQAVHSLTPDTIPQILLDEDYITVVACGTSYHAGMIFAHLLEAMSEKIVKLEIGSEFKYAHSPVRGVLLTISQSGETADTVAAVRRGGCFNRETVAITNVLGSSITREADHTLLMHAGPEISVAATKSFIAQLGVLLQMVNIMSGEICGEELSHVHKAIVPILSLSYDAAVDICAHSEHMFYVGRGVFYPVVMEGALKLKEISYIHAEAYAAGELKHGPFALLSPETPVVAVCLPGPSYAVMTGNLKEIKARGAPLIVLGDPHAPELIDIADCIIPIKHEGMMTDIITTSVALQLLAYYVAVKLGRDIDKPRNLAKSVTVE
ncbi:MAG: glutamine--fructose-6-phosphate transaminase (isomerizing) [Methanomicrobiales archaeon]|jgi:glucosamine--fructose-6-phosphate aminotransferase (isomerizing)|nr:glutamine--fructose-6-phosphate transaminase (isomerizing) [Methanomicrobiales archaeon]